MSRNSCPARLPYQENAHFFRSFHTPSDCLHGPSRVRGARWDHFPRSQSQQSQEVLYEIRKEDARVGAHLTSDSGCGPDGELHKDRGSGAIPIHGREQERSGRTIHGCTGHRRRPNTGDSECRRKGKFVHAGDANLGQEGVRLLRAGVP